MLQMDNELPLKTFELRLRGNIIEWPKEVPENAYSLTYFHSQLQLNMEKPTLYKNLLYEAWAFDRSKSWHIWKRDNEWVCTVYDTTKDSKEDGVYRTHLLAKHFVKNTGKRALVVYERIAYDDDEQAYIAYSCPLDLT